MPNRTYALEWLSHAGRNLETAQLLFSESHYTDIIGIEIQQTVEKIFKSVFAYHGMSIPRTHSLPLLFNQVSTFIELEDFDFDSLVIISDYYEIDRYPGPKYEMPPRSELEKFLPMVEKLYHKVFEMVSGDTSS